MSRNSPLLLLTPESYQTKYHGGGPPSALSVILTTLVGLAFFCSLEQVARLFLYQNKGFHELLEDETNRYVIARYVGVDAVGCTVCSVVGYLNRQMLYAPLAKLRDLTTTTTTTTTVDYKAWHKQAMSYDPISFRMGVFFLAYQVKDMYDTLVWGDDVEFIIHHFFTIVTAWGCLYPGFGHVYTAFYFGISEVSTAVLCLLAPFDKVEGLGEAFPSLKIGLGTAFAVLFLLVRVLIWPLVSLSNARDSYRGVVFCRNGRYRPGRHVFWFAFFLISLSSLTVLQILWLFVILYTLRTEVNLLLQP